MDHKYLDGGCKIRGRVKDSFMLFSADAMAGHREMKKIQPCSADAYSLSGEIEHKTRQEATRI